MTSLNTLTLLDWLVMGTAAALCLGLGLVAGRRVRTGSEFLTAGRRFPTVVVALSLFATLGSGVLLAGGVAGVCQRGLVAVRPLLLGWIWLPVLMLLWAPVLQRNRLTTAPEYLGRRFSPGVRRLAAGSTLVLLMALLALELAAFGATFRALTGGPAWAWAAGAVALAAIYTAWGGQRGAVVTNLLQAGLVGVGVLVLVLVASKTVQLAGLWQTAGMTQRSLVPEMLTAGPAQAAGGLLVDAAVISMVGLLASQAVVGRMVAGRGERAAGGAALLGLGPLLLVLVAGVAVLGLLHGWLVDVGRLPTTEPSSVSLASVLASVSASPGLLGLFAAAVLAAVLSTVDALLLGVAAVIAVDLTPEPASEDRVASRRQLRVARLAVGAAAGLALGLAVVVDWLGGTVTLTGLAGLSVGVVGGPLGLVIAAGLVSRRLSERVALVALAAGTVAGLVSLAWLAGPAVVPVDVLRSSLTATGVTTGLLVAGRLLAWRQTPPVRLNLTWRNLTPPWPYHRAQLPLKATDPSSEDHALPRVKLSEAATRKLKITPGNEVHVTAARRAWLGLRSFRAVVQKGPAAGDRLEAPRDALEAAGLSEDEQVVVERVA